MILCFPDVQLFLKALFSLCISDSLWLDVRAAEFSGCCDPHHVWQTFGGGDGEHNTEHAVQRSRARGIDVFPNIHLDEDTSVMAIGCCNTPGLFI